MSLGGQRILVVEDECFIAFEIEHIIREAQGEIAGRAATLAKAMELVDTVQPSLAVLDFRLRAGTTMPAAAKLYENGVPFLFHTACCQAELAGVWPHVPVLLKPAAPGRLVSTLIFLARGAKAPFLASRCASPHLTGHLSVAHG
jgi:DNA-binding LytR/AlgR family response regulator